MSNYHYVVEYFSPDGTDDESYEALSERDAYKEAALMEEKFSGGRIEINCYFFDEFEETMETIDVSWKQRPRYNKPESPKKRSGETRLLLVNNTQHPITYYIYAQSELHDVNGSTIPGHSRKEISLIHSWKFFSVVIHAYSTVYLYHRWYEKGVDATVVFDGRSDEIYKCSTPSGCPLSSYDYKRIAKQLKKALENQHITTLNGETIQPNDSKPSKENGGCLIPIVISLVIIIFGMIIVGL